MQNRIIFILFLGLFFFKSSISSAQQKDIYNFSADKLTYSQDNNIIEAIGNVVAKNQEGKQISADKIIYNKSNQLLKTFGNSKFSDTKNRTLTAENFEYDLEKKIISAENKVKFLDNLAFIDYCKKLADNREAVITAEAVEDIETLRFLLAHQIWQFQAFILFSKISINQYKDEFEGLKDLSEEIVFEILSDPKLMKEQKKIY